MNCFQWLSAMRSLLQDQSLVKRFLLTFLKCLPFFLYFIIICHDPYVATRLMPVLFAYFVLWFYGLIMSLRFLVIWLALSQLNLDPASELAFVASYVLTVQHNVREHKWVVEMLAVVRTSYLIAKKVLSWYGLDRDEQKQAISRRFWLPSSVICKHAFLSHFYLLNNSWWYVSSSFLTFPFPLHDEKKIITKIIFVFKSFFWFEVYRGWRADWYLLIIRHVLLLM